MANIQQGWSVSGKEGPAAKRGILTLVHLQEIIQNQYLDFFRLFEGDVVGQEIICVCNQCRFAS